MSKDKRVLGKVGMALLLVFFYAPILFMIIFSFNSSKSLTHFTGFSLRWYEAMLKNHGMMESLYVTIIVALLATIISTIVGTITAIGLSKSKKVLRAFVSQVNDFPIMNPEIVTAIGLMLLFITFQIEKGFVTLLLAHIAFCIPYVILSIMPKIKSLDPNLADAAMDLGATPWQALVKVIVPQIMPGIVSGALIAFTMSFDDFVISYFVTGQGVKNLSIMVYTMSKRINPSVNAISTVVVLLITITLIIVNVLPMIRKKTSPSKQNKPWKWVVAGVVVVGLVASLFGLNKSAGSQPYAGQTLHVYNWGEYTGENIISGFEELTGAKVIMDNFDSNEQMYIKVANGDAYDVLVPSDYMIQRMMQEKMLQKLEPETRKECLGELVDAIKGLPYDPKNEYSIPYFWGTVGIVYDKTKVSEEDLEKDGWDIFLDQKFKGDIYLYDSERDSFMMALKALGYSMNTTSQDELNDAYNWLIQCVQTMDPEIVTDEIIDNMAQARKALGLIYSGDAAYVMSENENIGFYMPKSGTNLWSDAMVIPKNAKNPKLANEFIRYITSYDAAMDNSSYVGYTSPNKEVMEELGGKGGDYDGINAYTPRAGYDKDEVFQYDETTRKIIADLWSRVKVAASNAH
ncbi:extracellular solute-binding protein [Holdemanella porci]|uniref:Extracellular solute-binding protein n=1 Tax=Holdemanella porci TaxID=2652276 RepID=A0A6N7VG29_9FIRM|nr:MULTISPECIES: extracellular solute-binding protein [Holdemanella]MCI7166104.1 extracellular solute-binding protein [Holdemanella sp.]MDY5473639.1 extracellular solute-binding protein [Holdemanella porci]MSS56089.1 extracellular solute-binding protein [Holdemanella porci]